MVLIAGILIKADHPLDPEFIGKHAEIRAPEGFIHGHGNRSA
jgi:hypothetical protein